MILHQRFIPGLAIYSYLIADEKSGVCAVIDPTRDVDYYVNWAKARGLQIRHILETHVHADFVSGSAELKTRVPETTVHCSSRGGDAWTPPYADERAAHGHEFRMGAVRLQAVHTPGHTPEHMSWAVYDETRSKDTPWLMFTGDFLFVGDVGRPDLLGEEARRDLAHQLYQSVFDRLPIFPDFTEIMPGHGAGSLCGKALGARGASTIGFERRFNPSLQEMPEEAWVKSLLDNMPVAPAYFSRMKKVNAAGPAVIGCALPGQQMLKAKDVHDRPCEECLIVDTRDKEAFAGAHIPGSINIPMGDTFAPWAGWVLPYDTPLMLVLNDPSDSADVVTQLLRIGLDDVRGYIEGGISAWATSGYALEHLETLSVQELHAELRSGDAPYVLDVRTEAEWNQGHIDGAHHIHGGLLQQRIDEIPRDTRVTVVCGSGYRASIASSFLKRHGIEQVANVMGGMSAYKAAGLPTVT